MMTHRFDHIVDALERRAEQQPHRPIYVYLQDGESREQTITYADLLTRARIVSGAIAQLTRAGDRVVVALPPCSEFFPAFWGCLHAGAVPCVTYPPARVSVENLSPIAAMCRDSGASVVITSREVQRRVSALAKDGAPTGLPAVYAFEDLAEAGAPGRRRTTDLAYLQYTSGSTSSPKGVRVMHRGLSEHLSHLCERSGYSDASVSVFWLPVHHSFGMIGGVMVPMYCGCTAVSMAPSHFLERPLRWLEAIDHYRATHSGASNFAYDMVSTQLAAGAVKRPLDLSCWKFAAVGGEAIQVGTLRRFQAELGKVGLPRTALAPGYGLSEATSGVSSCAFAEPVVVTLDGAALECGQVVPCGDREPGARSMVSVGPLLPGLEMKLVDPNTAVECPGDRIGEVWLRGGAVADGYWGRPEQSAVVFEGQLVGSDATWLRTGDLGFVLDDELFITGRCKEVVIVRGSNFFPADLEATIRRADPMLQDAPVAAFPVEGGLGDGLGVAVELAEPRAEVAQRIRARIASEHGIECGFLAMVPPGSLPRTGSGKLQRLVISRLARSGELAGEHSGPARVRARGEAVPQWGLDAVVELLTELDVGVGDDFGEGTRLDTLALSSVSLVRFAVEIKLRYRRDVGLAFLLEPGRTVADLLGDVDAQASVQGRFDYHKDACVPPDIATALSRVARPTRSPPTPSQSGDILLTGATGYLGANLLQDLVRAGTRRIHCLVRADSREEGLSRLHASVERLTGARLPATDAVHVVDGDVAESDFRLARRTYESLAQQVSTVVHAAAHVNFAYPYAALRGPNVLGTREVLRFCATRSLKTLHFLSTVGVLATGNADGPPRAETDAVEPEARLHVGYEQSKWVADRTVALARGEGLPAWIHRVGFVGGRSDDGSLLRTNEFFPSLIRGCVELGSYPKVESPFGFVPVDWVASVISAVVLRDANTPTDLHLVHPDPLSTVGCFERLRRLGYRLEPQTFEQWKEGLFGTPADVLRRNALFDYLPFLAPLTEAQLHFPSIEFGASRRIWSEHPCPDATDLLDAAIEHMQASGDLPRP